MGIRKYSGWGPSMDHRTAMILRLLDAGLTPDAAARVAAHPYDTPVVLGPGVVISVFTPPGVDKVAVRVA